MIQLKNDSIRAAAEANQSRYNAVNTYAQNAYRRLDDSFTASQADFDTAYNRAAQAAQGLTQANIEGLGLQKQDAYDAYMSGRSAANQAYQKYASSSGAFGSRMVESGLSGGGYEQVVKARAFSQRQSQLAAANAQLQKQLTQIDSQIAQAKAEGDSAQAQYYLQRAEQMDALRRQIASELNGISAQVYNMNAGERDYEYKVSQDAIAHEQQERQLALSAESNRLAREKFKYEKENNKSMSALQKQYSEQIAAYEAKIAELEAKLQPQYTEAPGPGQLGIGAFRRANGGSF